MKNILIITICLGSGVYSHAQQMDSIVNNIKWVNMIQVGQMFSNNNRVSRSLSGSWSSGVQKDRTIVGVELGFNDYEIFNVVGTAALLGKYRLRRIDESPYSYCLIGYGLPLYYKNDQILNTSSTKGGLMYGLGMGVDLPIGKMTFLIQLGYKFQKITYEEPNYYYNEFADQSFQSSNFVPNGGDNKYTTRKMHRVEFKIGLQF